MVYDKQKTALVDDPSDLINTRRLYPGRFLGRRQSTRVIRSLGSSTRAVFLLSQINSNLQYTVSVSFAFTFIFLTVSTTSHLYSPLDPFTTGLSRQVVVFPEEIGTPSLNQVYVNIRANGCQALHVSLWFVPTIGLVKPVRVGGSFGGSENDDLD
jgi:hypothetical protein